MASRKHYREIADALGIFEHHVGLCRDDDDTITISLRRFGHLFDEMVGEIAGTLKRENRAFDMTRFRDAIEEMAKNGGKR